MIRMMRVSLLGAALALATTASAQPSLSGMTFWRAQPDGSPENGGGYWNTQQPCCESWSNVYLTRVPDAQLTPSSWINNGPSGDPAFTSPLSLGANTFYFYASSSGWPRYGMNLFFGSTPASPTQAPGISALNVAGTPALSAIATSPPGAPDPCTFAEDISCVPGAGTLSFLSGSYRVTLSQFEVLLRADAPVPLDRVSGLGVGPDGAGDNYGYFTLQVTTTAPEPTSVCLVAGGLFMMALPLARRRRTHRSAPSHVPGHGSPVSGGA